MPSCLPLNVEDLLHFRGVESARVELKASWNEQHTLGQVIETICAFANDFYSVNGGYLVIGVEEQDGVAVLPPKGLSPGSLDVMQRSIRGNCRRIDPEYQPVLSPEVVDGRHILVIWAPASDTRPHQAPTWREPGKREFFVRLGPQTVKAEGQVLADLLQMAAKVPFDDRRALAFTLDDIRSTLVREYLRDVRSALLEERNDAEVYRCMRLTFRVNGHEVPRNVALLLFSEDPEEKGFRGARIEVVHFADGAGGNVLEERIFRGPLLQQTRDCLSYLGNLLTSYVEKHPDRAETAGWVSFPYQALRETIVNAVYHRSYDGTPEPTKVYLYPDRIEITSYPGPVPGLAPEHFRPGRRIPQTPARNRRIGEFLKELRLAEARSTGVPKVFQAMAENGSPEPRYEFDQDRTYFTVILPAHPEYVALTALREAALASVTGDRRGAIRRLEAARAAAPGSGLIAARLIEELCREGDLDGAEQVYVDLREHAAEPRERLRGALALARGYLDAKRTSDAVRILDALGGVATTITTSAESIDLAMLERRAGRYERAHQIFRETTDQVLRDSRATYEYARTKLRLAEQLDGSRRRLDREARQRLLREAEGLLRRVTQMQAPAGRRARAWRDLAAALQALKAPQDEVRRALAEAEALQPDVPPPAAPRKKRRRA